LIQPASGGTVSISFNYFSTEVTHDTLVFYDGENDTYPILGKFSGGSIPLICQVQELLFLFGLKAMVPTFLPDGRLRIREAMQIIPITSLVVEPLTL
jgi:hypothetical protein